ncbi:MAG: CoA pyrophosphatase [Formivibrio sp.]|nr:CoA pyrophosphatase [Formivibrio sp.]
MILPHDRQSLAQSLRERLAGDVLPLGGDIAGRLAGRQAAVLVLLVLHPQGPTILLTRRAAHLPAHPGQISFPGGAREDCDVDLVATALRETQEEIGLSQHSVEVLGMLGEYQTSSLFCVTPVVGLVEPGFLFSPDTAEVEEVFEIPAAVLLDPSQYERRWVERGGMRIKSHFLDYEGRLVWGATAGMLIGFARLLGSVGEPMERDDLVHYP